MYAIIEVAQVYRVDWVKWVPEVADRNVIEKHRRLKHQSLRMSDLQTQ